MVIKTKSITKKKAIKKKVIKKSTSNDLKKAKQKLSTEFKKAKEKLLKAEKDLHKYIEKNPKKAALISVGIGTAIVAGITAAILKKKK